MEEYVILVDQNDNKVGLMPKMMAHEKALLHRAFSVFIFNDNNELMLQQRALDKYHSPGLWTNTQNSTVLLLVWSQGNHFISLVVKAEKRLQEEV